MELINNGLGENQNSGYDRVERWDEKTTAALTEHYGEILKLLGENGEREGLERNTPKGGQSHAVSYPGLWNRSGRYPEVQPCFMRIIPKWSL